jgi:arginine/lysine/ornithine decarboxylase
VEREQLLLEKLKRYAATDAYPLHMPGHKRQMAAEAFPDPFGIDITEIDGFDNLHHPEGILKESMEWAAGVYGSNRTWYLVNGSSCGILSAVFAAVRRGGTILMSRNSHKSAYHAVILNELKKIDIYPHVIGQLGISGGILPEDVDKMLEENPDAEAVFIVSPTYDGVVSDVAGIARVVHEHGIPLIVDEAHGAHFSFGDGIFPESAVKCGADLVIQSVHKTLPSLTQTAVLHARKGFVDIGRLEKYLQMFQTSSPSYILMASIEQCIFEMEKHGAELCSSFMGKMAKLRQELKGLKNIRLLDRSFCGESGVFDVDESKMVISVKDCFYHDAGDGAKKSADGICLSGLLREKYHLEIEMAGADYVLAILTCFDTDEGLGRLKNALIEIDKLLNKDKPIKNECLKNNRSFNNIKSLDIHKSLVSDTLVSYTNHVVVGQKSLAMSCENENEYHWLKTAWERPQKVMELAEAAECEWEEVRLCECEGRISTEFIYLYPPGIPIVAPGEIVTREIISRTEEYKKKGFPVQGMTDEHADMLRVVK